MLFSKPVYGDPHSKTALIIRAKQLRNRRTGEVKLAAEIVGMASRIYSFNGELFQIELNRHSLAFGSLHVASTFDRLVLSRVPLFKHLTIVSAYLCTFFQPCSTSNTAPLKEFPLTQIKRLPIVIHRRIVFAYSMIDFWLKSPLVYWILI